MRILLILFISISINAIGQEDLTETRFDGLSKSYPYNSTQKKSLLIGDWGYFIITKDSIFLNKK